MSQNPLMTAIRMYDGTVLYTRNMKYSLQDGLWLLNDVRVVGMPGRIEKFDLHEDSIEVWFDILEGGKSGVSKSTDGTSSSA